MDMCNCLLFRGAVMPVLEAERVTPVTLISLLGSVRHYERSGLLSHLMSWATAAGLIVPELLTFPRAGLTIPSPSDRLKPVYLLNWFIVLRWLTVLSWLIGLSCDPHKLFDFTCCPTSSKLSSVPKLFWVESKSVHPKLIECSELVSARYLFEALSLSGQTSWAVCSNLIKCSELFSVHDRDQSPELFWAYCTDFRKLSMPSELEGSTRRFDEYSFCKNQVTRASLKVNS
ncbi:putative disease resistance protein [Dorcoceras hygrometricum]|uniref:Putative disease resistance protein n=1 Tax=Dorcoceras hygrometricum TaxID=472368 RepID=A0A2Z7CAU6_9LAMI|nr:putative disease resistance protein [Dorcoceras hygrometricum]